MQRQISGRAVMGAMFGLGGLLLLSLVALGSATIASDVGNVAVALLHERLSGLGWVGLGLPPGDGSVSSAEHGSRATQAGPA